MVKFLVNAKRWFDRKYGNTYHTVVITDLKTGKDIYYSGFTYGYGDHYKQTALAALIKMGKLKKEDMYNHELVRKLAKFIVNDVERKRELDLEKDTEFMDKLRI